jgi:hypothetical protein
MSIQMALSVGAPVKNRETSDPKDLVAFTPKTIRVMPPARSANEMSLFIDASKAFYLRRGSSPFASGNEIDQHDDDRNDKKDMDNSAHGVTADKTEQPEDDQDYRNGVQHISFTSCWLQHLRGKSSIRPM